MVQALNLTLFGFSTIPQNLHRFPSKSKIGFPVLEKSILVKLRQRSQRKRPPKTTADPSALTEEQAADELDALGEVLRQEARQVALRELAQLDDQQRQVVLLKVIQGMTLRQVAEVVDISVSLVNYRLNQGLTELAQRLKKAGVV